MEKINVIGCFLGQGLTDLRLPCEVYHRANIIFSDDWGKKFIFTEEDDKTILNYMKVNAKTDRTPYASLSKILGCSREAIVIRYTRILQHGVKGKSGRYTDDENREILMAVFQDNKDALHHTYSPSHPLWIQLGEKLNRRPYSIYLRWTETIKSNLILFENGVQSDR